MSHVISINCFFPAGPPHIPPQIQEMETTLELNSGLDFKPTCRVSGNPAPSAQDFHLFKEDGTVFEVGYITTIKKQLH